MRQLTRKAGSGGPEQRQDCQAARNPYTRSVTSVCRKPNQNVVTFLSIFVQLFGCKWKSSSKLDLTRLEFYQQSITKEKRQGN